MVKNSQFQFRVPKSAFVEDILLDCLHFTRRRILDTNIDKAIFGIFDFRIYLVVHIRHTLVLRGELRLLGCLFMFVPSFALGTIITVSEVLGWFFGCLETLVLVHATELCGRAPRFLYFRT